MDGTPTPGLPVASRLDRRRRPRARWWSVPGAVRITSHAAVWAAALVPMFAELSRGWRPFGDDAAIASRSYQVLSLHPPLTGLASAASTGTGHTVFDPGPLLFFLLSVPVRIDPAHGLLWGAAFFGAAVLSVSIEAAWSGGRWLAGAAVAFAALDLVWLTPAVFENLAWNAYFPLPFFIAAVVLAWVVSTGATGWWPVLVFAASVAAQCHLIFLVPGVVLTVVALAFGLFGTRPPRRLRWLGIGLGVGVLCWLAPLIQELGGRGNLTALFRAGRGQATLGLGFGLRMVGLAGAPHPVWLTHLPSTFDSIVALEYAHAPWYGGLVLGLLGVITVVALTTGRRVLGALGAVSFAVSAGMVVSFAVFPHKNFISLDYLVDVLWVVGVLVWAVVVWAALSVGWVVLLRARRATAVAPPIGRTGALAPWAGALAVAALAIVGVLGIRPAVTRPGEIDWNPSDVALVARAATAIERAVPVGPVGIQVALATPAPPSLRLFFFFLVTWSTEGVAFRLEADGWRPGVSADAASYTGLAIPPDAHWPSFLITLRGARVASVAKVR